MAKVTFSTYVTRRKGYVMTTRDIAWAECPDGAYVRVGNGKRGRPAKVRAVCVRWTCGQAYTYGWNPCLRREATEGMKRSQGQMKEAVAKAKAIWADPVQKAAWQARYKREPGKYKSAWMMLVGDCMAPKTIPAGGFATGSSLLLRGAWGMFRSARWEAEKRLRRSSGEVTTTLHVPIKIKNSRYRGDSGYRSYRSGCGDRGYGGNRENLDYRSGCGDINAATITDDGGGRSERSGEWYAVREYLEGRKRRDGRGYNIQILTHERQSIADNQ